MKKMKLVSVVLAAIMVMALLSGCMAEVIETTLNADGTGTFSVKVGYTQEYLESEAEEGETIDLSEYQSFEYNGTTYYGTVQEQSFSGLEELNALFSGDNSEDTALASSAVSFTKNADNSFTLTVTPAAAEEATEETPEADSADATTDADVTPEDAAAAEETAAQMEEAMSEIVMVMEVTLPGRARQLAGEAEGVTVDGGKVTLDLTKLNGEAADAKWVFSTIGIVPSSQNVTVDGEAVDLEIYNIGGNNYFKLRDIAKLLDGTDAQFEVGYDEATRTVSVTTGESYTADGKELATGTDKSASCLISNQPVTVNGEAASLEAYNLGGNNFFKLRDLGEALSFGVDYDEATRTVLITSK